MTLTNDNENKQTGANYTQEKVNEDENELYHIHDSNFTLKQIKNTTRHD